MAGILPEGSRRLTRWLPRRRSRHPATTPRRQMSTRRTLSGTRGHRSAARTVSVGSSPSVRALDRWRSQTAIGPALDGWQGRTSGSRSANPDALAAHAHTVHPPDICHEPDPRGWRAHRIPKPGEHLPRSGRQGRADRRRVRLDPAPVRPRVPHHQQPRGGPDAPSPGRARSSGPRRALRSMPYSIACTSGVTDLTSITTSARRTGCHASTSIEPRSPPRANDTSTATSQPVARNQATTRSTSAACPSSSSRSSPSPCQRISMEMVASSASATATIASSVNPLALAALDPAHDRSRELRRPGEVRLPPAATHPQRSHRPRHASQIHHNRMAASTSRGLIPDNRYRR